MAFGCTQTNCKSEIKIKAFPPPKCFRSNNYLFNLLEPTRDDYNTHLIIVSKPIIHISMALKRFTLATVGASSSIHVMEQDLIQIRWHAHGYNIIIVLANASPYIYKEVYTLPVLRAYSLLNLDKGQLCWAGKNVGC